MSDQNPQISKSTGVMKWTLIALTVACAITAGLASFVPVNSSSQSYDSETSSGSEW